MPGMTRLQGGGLYLFLNKKFNDIFFKDSNQRLESVTLKSLCCIYLSIKVAETLNEEAAKLRISEN